ncbi:hypothetical protein KKF84_11560, partial [Myxococcota bacterium]|nr:hypothetical protein [Myxococcota bacterium]
IWAVWINATGILCICPGFVRDSILLVLQGEYPGKFGNCVRASWGESNRKVSLWHYKKKNNNDMKEYVCIFIFTIDK